MKVMIAVMEKFIASHDALPGAFQCHAFIQQHAVRLALEATRDARLGAGDPSLWHDPSHAATTPVVDLAALQSDPASRAWQDLLNQLKPRAFAALRGEGLAEADAEDVFAEAMTAMLQVRASGTAILQSVLVAEQLPGLFVSIVRRRMSNFLRNREAAKRSATRTISLHGDTDALDHTDRSAFETWASSAVDPLRDLPLDRIADECGHLLTPLQQRILSVLYIEESATYMEVATAAWFTSACGLKPAASDATRRRALDREHDTALDRLADCLGITRRQT